MSLLPLLQTNPFEKSVCGGGGGGGCMYTCVRACMCVYDGCDILCEKMTDVTTLEELTTSLAW